jgi:hypothetical protein
LTSISYGGTIAEWMELTYDNYLFTYSENYTIYCTDGTIDKNGNITLY